MKDSPISIDELCEAGVYATRFILRIIQDFLERDPVNALERLLIGNHAKPALTIDKFAEIRLKELLQRYKKGKFGNIEFHGEESLRDPQLDLSNKKQIVVLADAVDGTDLLERGLSNWCSTWVAFKPYNPGGSRILAAFVGVPTGDVYFARCDQEHAFVKRGLNPPVPVSGPSDRSHLEEASLCFYGQKIDNFESLLNSNILKALKSFRRIEAGQNKSLDLRLYNLGGIPMMVKLVDHCVRKASGIDAIIELQGQKPHDFVPGAYIAKKAGASIVGLDGAELPIERMESALLRPASEELTYIMACTGELSRSIVNCLRA